jgi:hypothetical protein
VRRRAILVVTLAALPACLLSAGGGASTTVTTPAGVLGPGAASSGALYGEPPAPSGSAAQAAAEGARAAAPGCDTLEGQCGYTRCKVAERRCAFPCATDADCIAGARCEPSAGNPALSVCAVPVP